MYLSDLQYFPNIIYLHTLYKRRIVHFVPSELFVKSSYRNRMELPSSNGVLILSIPIKGGRSVKLPYGDVEIDYRSDWQLKHFRTIRSVFGNSPFYQFYEEDFEGLYSQKVDRLFDWNLKCLDIFLMLSKMSNLIQFDVLRKPVESEFTLSDNLVSSSDTLYEKISYQQVFSDRIGFKPNMSCLDLLMNLGPESGKYIQNLANKPT